MSEALEITFTVRVNAPSFSSAGELIDGVRKDIAEQIDRLNIGQRDSYLIPWLYVSMEPVT